MALDFSGSQKMAQSQGNQSNEVAVAQNTDITVVESYDIVADRKEMTANLVNSKEVDAIVSTLEIHNMESIVTFGAEVADGISKASDTVLNSMSMDQLKESGAMLSHLAKVMDQFDLDEVTQEEKGLFGKIFSNAQKNLEKLLGKYDTMGSEVDKIYIELKKYESEITVSNRNLDKMFQSNVEYYHELVKYILAGEQGIAELTAYIDQRTTEMQTSGDNSIQFEVQSLQQSLMLLEQRVHDLRIAENVAIQSIPMIKTMEFSNMNLVRKINSAFIITMPVFKQALAQAMMLKRQKIQAEAMSALDQKTNEMLLKNAQNTVNQSKMTAKMASGSSIKIETLESSWRTIMNGIEETRQIQENAHSQRADEKSRLEQIKKEFDENFTKK